MAAARDAYLAGRDVHVHTVAPAERRDEGRLTSATLGRPIRSLVDPISLNVHPVIDDPAAPPGLPEYLLRGHDKLLRELLSAPRNHPVMAVIVGGSSTGKTRAAFEALHYVLPDGRLYQPIAPSKPRALINLLANDPPASGAVLWLDELQEYFMPAGGEEAAAYLHEFLLSPSTAIVIATMWADHWALLTKDATQSVPAPYPQTRNMLRTTAHRINIDAPFSKTQLADAARNDSRLQQARDSAEDSEKITQYLAAGFALVERYNSFQMANNTAPWAAITACIDAYRLGHPEPFSENFIEAAVPRYMSREEWAMLGSDWLSSTLAAATQLLRGAARPLAKLRPYPDEGPQPARYQLADYLAQWGSEQRRGDCPPESFWQAAADFLGEPTSLARLGFSGAARGRLKQGALLYYRAAQVDEPSAVLRWANILWEFGNQAVAEEYFRKAAVLGESDALSHLAGHYSDSGKREEAVALYEQAASAGESNALRLLASYLWDIGEIGRAGTRYAQAIESGDKWARWWWALALEEIGEHDRVVELCKDDMVSARPDLTLWWVPTLFRVGESELAVTSIKRLASNDRPDALWRWAEELWEEDRKQAEDLFRQSIDMGDPDARRRWAGRLAASHELTRAKEMLLQAAADGDDSALRWLAGELWDDGELDEAEEYYVLAANAGHWWDVAGEWAERLNKLGQNDRANRLEKFGLTCDGKISDPWELPGLRN